MDRFGIIYLCDDDEPSMNIILKPKVLETVSAKCDSRAKVSKLS
jgi:hypothetical protein